MNDKVREWLQALLVQKLRDYSEDHYAAGWNGGLECIVWRKGHPCRDGNPEAVAIVELGKHIGAWAHWNPETQGIEVVPLDVWEAMYDKWWNDGLE